MVHTYRSRDGEMGGRDRRTAGSFLASSPSLPGDVPSQRDTWSQIKGERQLEMIPQDVLWLSHTHTHTQHTHTHTPTHTRVCAHTSTHTCTLHLMMLSEYSQTHPLGLFLVWEGSASPQGDSSLPTFPSQIAPISNSTVATHRTHVTFQTIPTSDSEQNPKDASCFSLCTYKTQKFMEVSTQSVNDREEPWTRRRGFKALSHSCILGWLSGTQLNLCSADM